MAKAIMIQGTMSNAGKSLVVTGLCRIFAQDGYRVAPFKSQNMALNSYVTIDGCEMGRAQVVQAQAAGILPDVRMNPILLKPTTDVGSQVIVMGHSTGNQKAFDYYKNKKAYIPTIMEAYESLASENDIIVIEGAGSPVEINLKENDIVNMGMAKMADAQVLLVGDIDRGGVFAQLLGTMELLEQDERDRVKGLIINKFRGDVSLLEPGLKMLEEKCGKPVIGVVPYSNVEIEDEDSLASSLLSREMRAGSSIDVAVIKLGKLSNFTDVAPLSVDRDVSVRYVEKAEELGNPDLLIIPGSKSTVADMEELRSKGLDVAIKKVAHNGHSYVLGICGGYQILGNDIEDRDVCEKTTGLGLLPITTQISEQKTTRLSRGTVGKITGPWSMISGLEVGGYEIHMGVTSVSDSNEDYIGTESDCYKVQVQDFIKRQDGGIDGYVCGNVCGTYFHGILENDEFRELLLDTIVQNNGGERNVHSLLQDDTYKYLEYRERQMNQLADELRASLDMDSIYECLFGENEDALTDSACDVRQTESLTVLDAEVGIDMPYRHLPPMEIEKKSFEIIGEELSRMGVSLDPINMPVIKRAIHTSADFEYVSNLVFSENAVAQMCTAIKNGACIVTDTEMGRSGINKTRLGKYGGEVYCYMADPEVAKIASETGETRATISMRKAVDVAMKEKREIIFAVGNAPTALIELNKIMNEQNYSPRGIIGVPVGFVNVVEAKELIIKNAKCPFIVARGRKGGSNIAAAIVNALVLSIER